MDGHQHQVIVLVNDLDLLLISAALRHTDQTAELAYSMVDMHHVVTDLELLQLLKGKRNLSVTGAVTLETVFVEPVKYLMVSKETALEQAVGITLMQCLVHNVERNFLTALGKDRLQTLSLLGVIGQNVNPISFDYIIS